MTLVLPFLIPGTRLVRMRRAVRCTFWVLVPLLFAHLLIATEISNHIAWQNGFKSGSDWLKASRENIADPAVWEARAEELADLAEKRAVADQLRQRDNADRAILTKIAQADLCREDAKCSLAEVWSDAQNKCSQTVEAEAIYGIRWENGFFEDRFSEVSWANQNEGIVYIAGDRAKLENEYGAWGRAEYQCSFSIPNGEVLRSSAVIKN